MKKQLMVLGLMVSAYHGNALGIPTIDTKQVMQQAITSTYQKFIPFLIKQNLLPSVIADHSVTVKARQINYTYDYPTLNLMYGILTSNYSSTKKLRDDKVWLQKTGSIWMRQNSIVSMSVPHPLLAALGHDSKRLKAFRELANFYAEYRTKPLQNAISFQELIKAGRNLTLKIKALLPQKSTEPSIY